MRPREPGADHSPAQPFFRRAALPSTIAFPTEHTGACGFASAGVCHACRCISDGITDAALVCCAECIFCAGDAGLSQLRAIRVVDATGTTGHRPCLLHCTTRADEGCRCWLGFDPAAPAGGSANVGTERVAAAPVSAAAACDWLLHATSRQLRADAEPLLGAPLGALVGLADGGGAAVCCREFAPQRRRQESFMGTTDLAGLRPSGCQLLGRLGHHGHRGRGGGRRAHSSLLRFRLCLEAASCEEAVGHREC
mmetsp:Transcript_77642/g.222471  ORF Transcript_77642/g.222471 Transcript_77642/m.222471 type:complete len:252 (+) Transcript_77642:861-1616(+)